MREYVSLGIALGFSLVVIWWTLRPDPMVRPRRRLIVGVMLIIMGTINLLGLTPSRFDRFIGAAFLMTAFIVLMSIWRHRTIFF